jgi:hypothetical protein
MELDPDLADLREEVENAKVDVRGEGSHRG